MGVKLHFLVAIVVGENCCWWQLLLVKIVVGDNCCWWQARLALCANSMWVPAFSLLWPLLPSDMWCWCVTSKPSQPWRWHWERCRRQGRSWSRAVTRDVSVVWNAVTQVLAASNTCQLAYHHIHQGLASHVAQSQLIFCKFGKMWKTRDRRQ